MPIMACLISGNGESRVWPAYGVRSEEGGRAYSADYEHALQNYT
jgi:hypothetical protein